MTDQVGKTALGHCLNCGAQIMHDPRLGDYCPTAGCGQFKTGKIEQLTADKRAVTDALVDSIDLTLKQNTRIRELENEKIALLDQLADAGMEIKRLRDTLLTIRHLAKALDHAGIKKIVDEHFGREVMG